MSPQRSVAYNVSEHDSCELTGLYHAWKLRNILQFLSAG
jgi:hypothetical protein